MGASRSGGIMTRQDQIGFSQRIQLDWLDYTANLVLAGNSRDEVVAALDERLQEKLSVGKNPERGNRAKTITILTRVWVSPPSELQSLHDEGLYRLRRLDPSDRILLHWCMCAAVYPFFGIVADATGRLIRLQGNAAAVQVQRRLRERLGERETVARSARRILRGFVDWGVLLETSAKGIYCGAPRRAVDDAPLALWVIKAVLAAQANKPRSAVALLGGPHLFPFGISIPSTRDLEASKDIEITRHGINHETLLGLVRATPNGNSSIHNPGSMSPT